MTNLIEYSLELPANKIGERLAKTVGRILKHTYSAKRLRIQHSKDVLIISARVDSAHLSAIRGAVKMTMMARGLTDERGRTPEVRNIAIREQSAAAGHSDRGALAPEAVQAQPEPATDDAPAVA